MALNGPRVKIVAHPCPKCWNFWQINGYHQFKSKMNVILINLKWCWYNRLTRIASKLKPIEVNFIKFFAGAFFAWKLFWQLFWLHVPRKSCWNDVRTKNARKNRWWNWHLNEFYVIMRNELEALTEK